MARYRILKGHEHFDNVTVYTVVGARMKNDIANGDAIIGVDDCSYNLPQAIRAKQRLIQQDKEKK